MKRKPLTDDDKAFGERYGLTPEELRLFKEFYTAEVRHRIFLMVSIALNVLLLYLLLH